MKPSARTNAARQVWRYVAGELEADAAPEIAGIHGTAGDIDRLTAAHKQAMRALATELRERAAGRKGKAIRG